MNKKNEEQWFLPYDRGFQGLNNNCERILQICEDNNVAIDLKHTSFANRLAIYEFIFDHDHAAPIASHCGVAFMTFTDYLVNNKLSIRRRPIWPHPIDAPDPDLSKWPRTIELEINRAKGPLNLFANCAQINLFDEDIVAIMSLGGLIGVSFDQRILGATALKNATRKQIDQMSPEDGNFIMAEYNNILQKLNIDLPLLDNAQIGLQNAPEGQNLFQDIAEIHRPTDKHFDYFIQTILYLLKVGYEHKIDNPWLYISMGSDFDGLIDAINVCKSSTKLPSLRTKMINYFKKNKNKKDVLKKVQADGIDMTQMVNQFMFFNAVEHFSEQMGLDGQEFIDGAVPA